MASRPPSPPKTALAATVRARRGATSQEALAEAIGVSQRALSRVEQGAVPQAETAARLARWLGWTSSAVLDAARRGLDVELGEGPVTHEVRAVLAPRQGADLAEALSALAPEVVSALQRAHVALRELGVRHVVVGGIAVSAYGFVRATRDVDFLVGDEAFERHGGLVTFKPGLPIAVERVAVDYLSPLAGAEMEAVLNDTPPERLAVIPAEMLVLMKLIANRPKDRADVVGLLQAGLDPGPVRVYLERVAPGQVARFERLLAEAGES